MFIAQTKNLTLIYDENLLETIKTTRVLIAGVGGIGSELIKSIIFAGFIDLTLIDYDVVDMSNLNRNLYFKTEHAFRKIPKVEAISKNITERYPYLKVKSYNKSIMSFNPNFFVDFDIVFCAVDDKEAREYLGRMCIIANKIMIESGTQGFAGSVKTQIRGLYACNYCRAVKNYEEMPSCSVRAIPTQSIHAVLWAKDLFEKLFKHGEDDEVYKFLAEQNNSSKNEDFEKLGKCIFDKYFNEEIKKLQNNELLESRGRVFPISYDEALSQMFDETSNNKSYLESQIIWSVFQCAEKFIKHFINCQKMKATKMPEAIFDKDNPDMIGFICAATNLRIYNFLNPQDPFSKLKKISLFEIKEKIGNIVPTITSTNSIVSGLQVTEAIKCLKSDLKSLRRIWLSTYAQNRLTDTQNNPPMINCEVCSFKNIYLNLEIRNDTSLRQLKEFIESYYCVRKPQISKKYIIFDPNEDDEEMNKIYNDNLDLKVTKFSNENSFKDPIMIRDLFEPFLFQCWFNLNDDISTPIIPDKTCTRERILNQQKRYLQEIQTENRKNIRRLYDKHLF